MTLNLDDLEATAKAATPGPWRWDEDFGENGDTGLALTNDARAEVVGAYNWHCCSFRDDPTVEDNDAEHIAAFDPPTVLALIAKLREVEAVIEKVRSMLPGSRTFAESLPRDFAGNLWPRTIDADDVAAIFATYKPTNQEGSAS